MLSGTWWQWLLFGFFAGMGFRLGQAVLDFAREKLARGKDSIDVEALVRDELAAAQQLAVDREILNGRGSR